MRDNFDTLLFNLLIALICKLQNTTAQVACNAADQTSLQCDLSKGFCMVLNASPQCVCKQGFRLNGTNQCLGKGESETGVILGLSGDQT